MGLWIDCHCDTLLRSWFKQHQLKEKSRKLEATSDLLIEGGIDVQVAAMFIPNSLVKSGLDITLEMVGLLTEEIRKDSNLFLLKHKSDFSKTQDKKKLGYILAMEQELFSNKKLLSDHQIVEQLDELFFLEKL